MEGIGQLYENTPKPTYGPAPDPSILDDLESNCGDSPYWQNFNKAAPIVFGIIAECDAGLKAMRDVSFIEEVIKVKDRLTLINEQLAKEDSPKIDIVEYSVVIAKLEHKMEILRALSLSNNAESESTFSFNLLGMNKHIKVDKAKLREAITVGENNIEERESFPSGKVECEEIPLSGIEEPEFLERVCSHVTDLELVGGKATGILSQDSFIKIFKYTNDLARLMDKNGK